MNGVERERKAKTSFDYSAPCQEHKNHKLKSETPTQKAGEEDVVGG
jgi:hypothetical protein